jgi:pyruvate dehydrogenase E2 component (dihydrolipoamide acetyltransferase)
MGRRPHRIACALIAVTLALPGAAAAQSAGDEQYEDPFAPEPGQTGDGGEQEEESGGQPAPAPEPAPAPAPAPAAPAPEPAAATTAQAELPRTGGDAGALALAGTLLLAGGVAVRVRLSAPARRRF